MNTNNKTVSIMDQRRAYLVDKEEENNCRDTVYCTMEQDGNNNYEKNSEAIMDRMIAMLMLTCLVSEEEARKLLQESGGDVEKAMLCLESGSSHRPTRIHAAASGGRHQDHASFGREGTISGNTASGAFVTMDSIAGGQQRAQIACRNESGDARAPEPVVPGAVAVEGPNAGDGNDEYTLTPTLMQDSMMQQEPVTATIVHHDEEDYESLQRELEWMRRERDNAAVAQVVSHNETGHDEEMQRKDQGEDLGRDACLTNAKLCISNVCDTRIKQIVGFLVILVLLGFVLVLVGVSRTVETE